MPPLQISPCRCAFFRLEGIIIKPSCRPMHLKEPCFEPLHGESLSRHLRLRQRDIGALRQFFHRFGKITVFHFHQKAVYIPRRSTAETVIKLFFTVDGKRRGLFVMERAKSEVRTALLLQRNVLGNDIHNVILHTDFLNQLSRIPHCPSPLPPFWKQRFWNFRKHWRKEAVTLPFSCYTL